MMREKDPNKIRRIFDAALKLVTKEGLDGIKMSKIAKEAGLASGTLYIYFESKEILLNKLYENVIGMWTEFMKKDYLKCGFSNYWNDNIIFAYKNYLEMEFKNLFKHSRYITKSNLEKQNRLNKIHYKMIEKAKTQNKIKDLDTELIAGIIGNLSVQVVRELKKNKKYDEKIVNDSLKFCWDGLKIN